MGKLSSPAALRNQEPIAAVLASELPASGLVLMIAEGSGVHAVHFAARFPALRWLPTDPDAEALASIAAWRAEACLPNLLAPLPLETAGVWPVDRADAITCINMVHISPWRATEALIAGAARIVPPGGLLYLYGPYRQQGVATASSNEEFDASLKARNADWGLREVDAVVSLARHHGFSLTRVQRMPANNLSVVFRRDRGVGCE